MSTRTEIALGFAGLVGIVALVWVGIAFFHYQHDQQARVYYESAVGQTGVATVGTTTTVVVATQQQPVQQVDTGWNLFWWGYMWGWWGPNSYSNYRTEVNNTYYTSPAYEAQVAADAASGSWGSDEGSWGSDNSSSWSSSNSGSWGSDDSSYSSSNDSGSWGSSDSYSSYDSGSWGD